MMTYTIRAGGLLGVRRVLHEHGANPSQVFALADLSENLIDTPDELVCYRKFLNLLNISARVTGREDFGLLLSQKQGFSALGAIGFTMKEAPDVRSAVKDLCEFLQIHMNGSVTTLEEKDGLAIWRYTTIMPDAPDCRQKSALAIAIGVGLMRRLFTPSWAPEFVYQNYRAPKDTTPFKQFFKCPVCFNQEINAMMFDAKLLDHKIESANDDLYKILRDYLAQKTSGNQDNFVGVVRSIIMDDLQSGACTIDSVARSVAMKRRTFQRRLGELGLNFSDLLEETRTDMAKRYLNLSDISLTQMSDMLGYSELAAFSRSFKRSTGKSPRAWRTQMAAQ